MFLVFPEQAINIAIFSSFTIFSAFIIDALQDVHKQIILGVFLSLTGIMALHVVPIEWDLALLLLLTLFILKLLLSFSVRWYSLRKTESEIMIA